MKNFWGEGWLAFRQRRPAASDALTTLVLALGWAIGSILASAPFKTVWFGTACMLLIGVVVQSWRYHRRAGRLRKG
jgi:hypothetical protein